MQMLTPEEVIPRTEPYFAGGSRNYLSRAQATASESGIADTARNPYDQLPLNLHCAGMACDQFITSIPPYPNQYSGRGIVICGGGVKYFTNAWVCIHMLRRLGCGLPVQLWHLGKHELDERMESLLAPLGGQFLDSGKLP